MPPTGTNGKFDVGVDVANGAADKRYEKFESSEKLKLMVGESLLASMVSEFTSGARVSSVNDVLVAVTVLSAG